MEKRNERKADLLRQAGQRQLMVAVGSFLFLIAYLFLLSQWVLPQLAALPSSGWLMRFVFIVCTCNYTEPECCPIRAISCPESRVIGQSG